MLSSWLRLFESILYSEFRWTPTLRLRLSNAGCSWVAGLGCWLVHLFPPGDWECVLLDLHCWPPCALTAPLNAVVSIQLQFCFRKLEVRIQPRHFKMGYKPVVFTCPDGAAVPHRAASCSSKAALLGNGCSARLAAPKASAAHQLRVAMLRRAQSAPLSEGSSAALKQPLHVHLALLHQTQLLAAPQTGRADGQQATNINKQLASYGKLWHIAATDQAR